MTLEEFITTNPSSYGSSNINLFYSSSISGSDTPIPPYTITGISIQDQIGSGLDISSALKNVNSLKFDFGGDRLTANILGRQKRTGYFFFKIDPLVTNSLPTTLDLAGNVIENDSEFVFVPYIQTSFNNNNYNPLINNSEDSKRNSITQQVDRNTSQANPTNLIALLAGNANPAEIQNCSYTKVGIISSRYVGTKTTPAGPVYNFNKDAFTATVVANTIAGNSPAASFKGFEGTVYPDDADTTAIKNINLSDRIVLEIFFDAQLTGTHPTKTFPNYPSTGNFVFLTDKNRFVRSVKSKIYSIDKDEVYTTDEFGGVILVE